MMVYRPLTLNEIGYVRVDRDSPVSYKLTTSSLDRPSYFQVNEKGETTQRSSFSGVLMDLAHGSFKFLSIPSFSPGEPPFVMKLEKKGGDTFFTMCNDLTVAPMPKALKFGFGEDAGAEAEGAEDARCLLYTSPSPRDRQKSRMPSSA